MKRFVKRQRTEVGRRAFAVPSHGMALRPRTIAVGVLLLASGGIGCSRETSPREETKAAPKPLAPPEPIAAPALAAPAPAGATEEPHAPRPLRVLLAGDVIAHRPVLIGEGVLARSLAPMRDFFGAADAVLVNHESATGDTPVGKHHELAYAAPPFWAKELAASRVTAIGLANNHACDLGRTGLLATVASAKESSLVAVGAGEEPWKAAVIAERDGHKVCAVGWSTLTNGDPIACDKTLAFAPESPVAEARVVSAIKAAKSGGCDAVVAIVHIGDEYRDQLPSVYALGARLADAGADAVAMHHPHVPSPMRTTTTKDGRTVPIFPSLGNLVSNQGFAWKAPNPVVLPNRKQVSANAWTRVGIVADLAFGFEAGKPTITSFGYHLVWNDRPKLEKRGDDAIVARLLTHADKELIGRFARDKDGPNAIFESPCWRDEPGHVKKKK